jgi:hypothetical protein
MWVGPVTLERGYFYCQQCRKGRYPLDEALLIEARTHFSDGVQQAVCLLGVHMPLERASHALGVLSGINISPKETQRITQERGLVLESSLDTEAQLLLNGELNNPNNPDLNPSNVGVWTVTTVTLDAGKVRYEDGWHDAKAGVVFWAEPTLSEQGETDEQ